MGRMIVSKRDMKSRMAAILTKSGLDASDAEEIADSLITAEAQGRESHGLMRLPSLYERMVNKVVNFHPDIKFEEIGSGLYHVDGDNGMGVTIAARTMDFCMQKARENGLAMAFVKNANHLNTCGYYTAKAAKEGFVGVCISNAGPNVAPAGGMSKLLGTSPFSVSFPAGKYDNFTLDVASSAAAYGKILMYSREGKQMPEGWAIDENGLPTTDAQVCVNAVNKGIGILPAGDYKGMGICMIVDMLAMLAGASFSYQVSNMWSTSNVSGVGHIFMCIDIQRLMPLEQFVTNIEGWFDLIKNDTPRPGTNGVFIPGEIEMERENRLGDNIDVFDGSVAKIEAIEKELGLA